MVNQKGRKKKDRRTPILLTHFLEESCVLPYEKAILKIRVY